MSIFSIIKKKINIAISKGYWFNNIYFEDCQKFKNYNTFNTKVVNLGSTSALNAFNYEGLGLKAANWALSHNPLAGDWAVLRNYCSFLEPNSSTVFIPLCPFSSLSGSYMPFEDRYYSILYPSTIPSYSYLHDMQVRDKWSTPIKSYPFWGFWQDIKHLFSSEKNKILTEEEMKKDSKKWMYGWFQEFSLKDFSTPLSLINIDNIMDAANLLSNIIIFCNCHNANPVLVIPPMYHTLAEEFTKEGREKTINILLKNIKKSDFLFLNYMDDDQFCHDRTIFKNSFLLNKKGAKLFTKRVLEDINVI